MNRNCVRDSFVTYKLLLLGDSYVGKTSLLIRFKDQIFLKGSYISTVGIDYKSKVVNIAGKGVKLQIWDTAGQEKFRSLTKSYYRDTNAVLLIYDITKENTFINTKSWLYEVQTNAPAGTIICLLGNKADKSSERKVAVSDGEQLASASGALFLETSAKSGQNVDYAFQSIAKRLCYRDAANSGESADDHISPVFELNGSTARRGSSSIFRLWGENNKLESVSSFTKIVPREKSTCCHSV